MQAIQTKILPCTSTKPTRIKAWAWSGELTMSIHSIPSAYTDEMHRYCAEQLQIKLYWNNPNYGVLESGTLPNGDYCHIMVKA